MAPGLNFTTILYCMRPRRRQRGDAVSSARAEGHTHALQSHLANRAGGATLRFGRVWTSMMIAQVTLTAIGIPVAMESASQTGCASCVRPRHISQSRYLAARIDVDRLFDEETTAAFEEGRRSAFAALEQRVAGARRRRGHLRRPCAGRAGELTIRTGRGLLRRRAGVLTMIFATLAVGPEFFEAFDRPIVAGRAFHGGDWSPDARTVIVNRGIRAPVLARDRPRNASWRPVPLCRLIRAIRATLRRPQRRSRGSRSWRRARRRAPSRRWTTRRAFVFHAASVGTVSPLRDERVRARQSGRHSPRVCRSIAADVDARLLRARLAAAG